MNTMCKNNYHLHCTWPSQWFSFILGNIVSLLNWPTDTMMKMLKIITNIIKRINSCFAIEHIHKHTYNAVKIIWLLVVVVCIISISFHVFSFLEISHIIKKSKMWQEYKLWPSNKTAPNTFKMNIVFCELWSTLKHYLVPTTVKMHYFREKVVLLHTNLFFFFESWNKFKIVHYIYSFINFNFSRKVRGT